MVDVPALAALIVAAVALLIAGLQLAQALLATAYVIKKCDRLVTGGVTRGGLREWHWRQFRFTVKYEAILFALPTPVYTSLGVRSTVQIDKPSPDIYHRALERRPKRSHYQGCWVSLVQDLVHFSVLRPEDMCIREESGDRIPDDLTIAPTRVDALSVMLTCVAMGMQVITFSPSSGQITLAGENGSVSSSVHPTLGLMLHYDVFRNDQSIGNDVARQHGNALRQEQGVWSNAIFGRFQNYPYSLGFVKLMVLKERHVEVLKEQGWPEDSVSNTLYGAACFMAFAHVTVYKIVPPSHSRASCANFAEYIVMGHHNEIRKAKMESQNALALSQEAGQIRETIVEDNGGSSLMCWKFHHGLLNLHQEKYQEYESSFSTLLDCEEPSRLIACPELVAILSRAGSESHYNIYPSLYLTSHIIPISWEIIQRADQRMAHIIAKIRIYEGQNFKSEAEKIVARTIAPLAEVGPPSYSRSDKILNQWPQIFDDACTKILEAADFPKYFDKKGLVYYAYLSLMRSAYYTIMMRASGDVGPGITDDSMPDTALAYMA
ncbi:MAG: hypothetical protein OHK93_008318 [Ramalina farinacea]|uniref:Uncharacterized protein n=1 Tax=Ramalina farinacea TaxID=258253 RepID=A0AA43QQ43_9LECA|nr:hypothetical protein [Ramalina farinacea]